jgi:hypothetical protein
MAGVSITFCSRSFHPIRCDFVAAPSGENASRRLGPMGDVSTDLVCVARAVRQARSAPQVWIPEAQPPFSSGYDLTEGLFVPFRSLFASDVERPFAPEVPADGASKMTLMALELIEAGLLERHDYLNLNRGAAG